MSYPAKISRFHPSCFLFLIDQSKSIRGHCVWRQAVYALSCLTLLSALAVSPAHAATSGEISRLIDDLGSDNFEVREKAAHRLAEMEDAEAALREAQKSKDLEIRHRVKIILLALERRRALRGLARAHVLGKTGRAVEAVDRLVKWGSWDTTGKGWDSLTQFARKATDDTASYFPAGGRVWKFPKFPAGDFQRYAKAALPREVPARKIDVEIKRRPRNEEELATLKFFRGTKLFRAEEISIKSSKAEPCFYASIIAASGNIRLPCAYDSLIVAGENIKLIGLQPNNLVICDGDIEFQWPNRDDKNVILTDYCIIVARGKAIPPGKFPKCLARIGHTLHLPDGKIVDLRDGTPDPLAFVKFFELADVGISAEDRPPREKSDTPGALLKDVKKDSPFASGLRVGDRIIAIEGKKTPTTEILRRTLRRQLAEDEPTITFTVQRSGKTMAVSVPMKR